MLCQYHISLANKTGYISLSYLPDEPFDKNGKTSEIWLNLVLGQRLEPLESILGPWAGTGAHVGIHKAVVHPDIAQDQHILGVVLMEDHEDAPGSLHFTGSQTGIHDCHLLGQLVIGELSRLSRLASLELW